MVGIYLPLIQIFDIEKNNQYKKRWYKKKHAFSFTQFKYSISYKDKQGKLGQRF